MISLPGKATPKSNSEQKKQELALAKLMAEREAYMRKNKGIYPSDAELIKSRKKSR